MHSRPSPGSGLFNLALAFFIGCVLIYVGVQLIKAVLPWIIAGLVIATIVAGAAAVISNHRERW